MYFQRSLSKDVEVVTALWVQILGVLSSEYLGNLNLNFQKCSEKSYKGSFNFILFIYLFIPMMKTKSYY